MKQMWITALGLTATLIVGCGKSEQQLNVGGATFVAPMMDKWSGTYHQAKGIKVNYNAQGSGFGIKGLIDKTLDFACSDAPLNEEQTEKARAAAGEVVHIPLVMGGVVPIYNLPTIDKPVHFTGPVLADIFLGKITNWNDPALKELNKEIELPDLKIGVVHRSDGSGTTYIFTKYLSSVSENWRNKIKGGFGTTISWETGTGAPGNPGVANSVKLSPGAIGYVELIYALENQLQYGAVKNKAGEFVRASLEAVTAAAAAAEIPDDLKISLIDMPGKESYPISGASFAITYVNPPSGKGKLIADFLRWATHEGQDLAKDLHYARLPAAVVEKVDKKLDLIKPGK